MEDKRISKTKKKFKKTLIKMLDDMPFEKITTTDLCKQAEISRITFYKYYGDKYALLDEIFSDMYVLSENRYHEHQNKNNADLIPAKSYSNLLNSIIEIYYENFSFFQYTMPEKNPDLAAIFQRLVKRAAENIIIKDMTEYTLKYSPGQIAAFFCSGMISFINESNMEEISLMDIRRNASRITMGILHSKIFLE